MGGNLGFWSMAVPACTSSFPALWHNARDTFRRCAHMVSQGLEWVARNLQYPALVHMSLEGYYSSPINAAVDDLVTRRAGEMRGTQHAARHRAPAGEGRTPHLLATITKPAASSACPAAPKSVCASQRFQRTRCQLFQSCTVAVVRAPGPTLRCYRLACRDIQRS
jgi:hypothetical protein